MGIIDEVKQRTDIAEIIGQYTTLKKAGRILTGLCPFHSEKHPSFFVYPDQQTWHCFGACGTGGDVFSFLMKKEGIDFGEALRLLADKAGISLPEKIQPSSSGKEKLEFFQVNEAAALYFNNLLLNSPAAEKARRYVSDRGFSQETIALFQLGYSLDSWESLKQYLTGKGNTEKVILEAGLLVQAESGKIYDRFRGKLMIPIRDIKGNTIGFGARVLDNSLPKYTNSPQTPTFDKSSSVYALDLASQTIRQQDAAVIMEGYMDVITAHQNGVKNAVACMGTAITETQISMLKKLSKNIYLSLDADTAGEEAMLRAVSLQNTLDVDTRVVILPEGKDPDNVIREDVNLWQDLVQKATPIIDFAFTKLTAQLDMTTARDKTTATARLLPIVQEIKDPIKKAHYIQKLAGLTHEDTRAIEAVLSQLKPATGHKQTLTKITEPMTRALRALKSNPREEYCLALLLQYPELKKTKNMPPPEYFESSENREILLACCGTDNLSEIADKLDPAIQDHFQTISGKNMLSGNLQQKYDDCILQLKQRFMRSIEAKRREIFASAAEAEGAGADLTRLEKEGIEPSQQLKETFMQKNRKRSEIRR
jgi:DNA primase